MKITVHGVTVNHRHGNDVMVATTREALYEQLAQFVGNYVDETTKAEEINALLERGDNAEAVGMYFENHPSEYADFFERELEVTNIHTDRIVRLRNDLVLWTMGQLALSLTQVGEKIIELDNRLQAQDQ